MTATRRRAWLLFSALVLVPASAGAGQPGSEGLGVLGPFADHMVLQRDKPLPIRGTAPAGAVVTVAFAGARVDARAGSDGRWGAVLPPQRGGAQGALVVSTAQTRRVFEDVVAGDVWLCSGQSNMDLPVRSAANPERTASEAAGAPIRILKIARAAASRVQEPLPVEIPWSLAGPETLPAFSAACWHMGLKLAAANVGAPIGLIHAAWGGSTLEDWMPAGALRSAGGANEALDLLERHARDPEGANKELTAATDAWAARSDPGSSQPWSAPELDDRGWATMALPAYWERAGIPALASYDGVMWFRREVRLTPQQARAGGALLLGRIDERDRVWVNGQSVGATLVADQVRRYPVAAARLRPGRNVIAIRVIDQQGAGGVRASAGEFALQIEGGAPISLQGPWRYRTGSERRAWAAPAPFVPWSMPRGVTMAWNAMIAPMAGYPLRGVAWYQGESNVSDPERYRALLPLWREHWRRAFNDPALPVVTVQLPGYGPRTAQPGDSAWAELREVQRQFATSDAKIGMAVTIDLGVPQDIHPAHKDVVGERMGMEALRVAYGRSEPRAPAPAAVRRRGGEVVVAFDHAPAGVVVYGSSSPTAFELCNRQRQCRFAAATVQGGSVVLPDPERSAVEVRYAWQGSPPINLYGASGLPATPFRMAVER
jgi:sialate O-acetylesterase